MVFGLLMSYGGLCMAFASTQVNAKVRRITVGAATAEAIETVERFQQAPPRPPLNENLLLLLHYSQA